MKTPSAGLAIPHGRLYVRPDGAQPLPALVTAFAEMSSQIYVAEDFDETLHRVTATATKLIPGCDSASISLVEKNGPVTRAPVGELALAGDQIQYDEGEGPCLDAALTQSVVYTPDTRRDARWARSAERIADEVGARSMLACRLTLEASPRDVLGAINMYSRTPDGFSEDDRMLAVLLASFSAVVLDSARNQDLLKNAIESRQVIGEAIGILRSQSDVSREVAFEMLAKASQRMNVKLRDLAREIADRPVTPR